MAEQTYEFDRHFTFTPLVSKKLSFLEDKDILTLLMKWSMLGRISAQSYSFDQSFNSCACKKFAECFFKDPNVVASLRKMEGGAWVPLDKPIVSTEVEVVPCTKVCLDLFDPLYSCGILRPSGHIVKCYHEVYSDYDELRQMLQDEDSEHYFVVGREERREFLFLLFKHLCVGGELSQYEDTIDPYINTTREIYKDLISVQKHPETKKISVVSVVLKVCARDEHGTYYPGTREEEQTFAYMVVDPFKRHVTVFYHSYGVGTFALE